MLDVYLPWWNNRLGMMQATSAGMKEQEAINFLEKKMKENPAFTYDETVQVVNSLLTLLFLEF